MIDYSTLLYDPVYSVIGVPANMTIMSGIVEITVTDYTRAKAHASGSAEIKSVGPSARARMPELIAKGIERTDFAGALLAFNGRVWFVRSWEMLGSPNGEDEGEVRFLLKAGDD